MNGLLLFPAECFCLTYELNDFKSRVNRHLWDLLLFIVTLYLALHGVNTNKKQEVRDNLSVCVLNILPKVSSLPNLLAINVMKVEI